MNIKDLENTLGISRNKSEYGHVKANSKSLNPMVLLVYREILEHEWIDSDYWTCGGNETVAELLSQFKARDWKDLENDLPNWYLEQLVLFCNVLTAVYDEGSSADSIIAQRSYYYGYIITIVDILSAIDLMEEFSFLKEGDPKPVSLLENLNAVFSRIEKTPVIINFYIRESYFEHLKSVLADVNKIAKYARPF